ncbi:MULTISPECIES: YlaI family protein [Sporosarcina]|uniref:YlaI family protein n=1 Tax=Sporosarcina TaxID=1569 RepID=UPI00058C794E|nr:MULTISPECIES: YlaI family protein [Sporosarcina]WJY28855.1 YlaI family protein [Sporosarcina sp. 0.2-SM1T-5]
MRVKCVLCDEISKLDDEDPLAKKLRNRPIHTFMCESCRDRIGALTEQRKESGHYVFRRSSHPAEDGF